MAQMSEDFVSILTNAGGATLIPYPTARGITSVALLARVVHTQEALEDNLAAPFIAEGV